MAPLAAFAALFFQDGAPGAKGLPVPAPAPAGRDVEAARFVRCAGAVRTNCVIDGDTLRYRGETIRIADINTPELFEPQCAREAQLAARAAQRLAELLNAGAFTLQPVDRETDRYGRSLRTVTRGGESLGGVLVGEGLAERWQGFRGSWC